MEDAAGKLTLAEPLCTCIARRFFDGEERNLHSC